jgi:hypothetical protein
MAAQQQLLYALDTDHWQVDRSRPERRVCSLGTGNAHVAGQPVPARWTKHGRAAGAR